MSSLRSDLTQREIPLEVDVLLATYNGADYIYEQLLSLAMQIDVSVNLFVSDDGSSDETIAIILSNRHLFKKLEFLENSPKLGPGANFFFLISNFSGSSEFVALMDQDDIWLPNHLVSSVTALKEMGENAALTFSSCIEFDEKRNKVNIWPNIDLKLDHYIIFFENLCRGCTIVLNKSAVQVAQNYIPQNAIMHDWWLFILISELGTVRKLETANIIYRIHSDNHTGRKTSIERLLKLPKLFRISNWQTVTQILEMSSKLRVLDYEREAGGLSYIVSLLENRTAKNRLRILLLPKRIRTSISEDAILRILLFLIP
jgi:glycosyltransferase involved in cell wall biosynthesis